VSKQEKWATMSEVTKIAPALNEPTERKRTLPSGRMLTKKALELVAVRGREVIGVRHLLLGGKAWVGSLRDAIARLPMREFGGQPLIVGEVTQEEYALYVPPRARARMHGEGGIPRLLVGPHKITLKPGERAVLVLGQVQIRARIIDIESCANSSAAVGGVAVWVAFTATIYAAALAVCAAFSPMPNQHLDHGAMQRVHGQFLAKTASR
jgi:hypothetical protein